MNNLRKQSQVLRKSRKEDYETPKRSTCRWVEVSPRLVFVFFPSVVFHEQVWVAWTRIYMPLLLVGGSVDRWSTWCFRLKTSDAGSQYRCVRVGRSSQPPFTPNALPNPLPNTDNYTKILQNSRFPTFRLMLTDGRTNRPTDRRTKPPIELRVRN